MVPFRFKDHVYTAQAFPQASEPSDQPACCHCHNSHATQFTLTSIPIQLIQRSKHQHITQKLEYTCTENTN
jgi:hypothetical protein